LGFYVLDRETSPEKSPERCGVTGSIQGVDRIYTTPSEFHNVVVILIWHHVRFWVCVHLLRVRLNLRNALCDMWRYHCDPQSPQDREQKPSRHAGFGLWIVQMIGMWKGHVYNSTASHPGKRSGVRYLCPMSTVE
jgi:hypothetical protein